MLRVPWVISCLLLKADYQILTFAALAQVGRHEQGLKWINRAALADDVENLVQQRFSFEQFWRLITRVFSPWPDNWDTANGWGMIKLGQDLDNDTNKYYVNFRKAKKIRKDTSESTMIAEN